MDLISTVWYYAALMSFTLLMICFDIGSLAMFFAIFTFALVWTPVFMTCVRVGEND